MAAGRATITDDAVDVLMRYSWPGNVRELEQMIERGVILAQEGKAIDTQDLFIQEDLEPCSMAEKDDLIETIFQAKFTLPELEESYLKERCLRPMAITPKLPVFWACHAHKSSTAPRKKKRLFKCKSTQSGILLLRVF